MGKGGDVVTGVSRPFFIYWEISFRALIISACCSSTHKHPTGYKGNPLFEIRYMASTRITVVLVSVPFGRKINIGRVE